MSAHTLRLAATAALLASGLGCVTPKVLVQDAYLPGNDKIVRTMVQISGSVETGTRDNPQNIEMTNMYVEICDLENSKATNCRTTLVLDNVLNYQFTDR